MVYTVTFNPALDYVMNLKSLSADDINRTESEELYYGGKGINVSAILSQLGIPNIALGFTAGFTGEKLKQMLDGDGIKNDFVELNSGFTRINVKVKFGKELDINANGPEITADKIKELFLKLKKPGLSQQGFILVRTYSLFLRAKVINVQGLHFSLQSLFQVRHIPL